MNFRPNLSKNEILIYNNVVGNNRAFLLSSDLQRNTEFHKTLTQICICGTVLMVAVLASLTDCGNLSHFNFKLHNYSVPLRWILPTLQCKQNVLSVGNQTKWESSRNIFFVPHIPRGGGTSILTVTGTCRWGRGVETWPCLKLLGAQTIPPVTIYLTKNFQMHTLWEGGRGGESFAIECWFKVCWYWYGRTLFLLCIIIHS